MKLPGVQKAVIADSKVRDYLLSFEHPVGRSNARFFASLGFVRDRWRELRDKLLALVGSYEAEIGEPAQFGQKYIVRGMIQGPTGQTAFIKTAWIIKHESDEPEFITAFPGDRK